MAACGHMQRHMQIVLNSKHIKNQLHAGDQSAQTESASGKSSSGGSIPAILRARDCDEHLARLCLPRPAEQHLLASQVDF